MHILSLPPPNSLPPAPFGRRQEPGNSLAKRHLQFSPARSEQYSYPSPPMSDSHSPRRRSAHLVESEGHRQYPPPVSEPRRLDSLPLPPPLDPRLATPNSNLAHQRPLYPGDPQLRGMSYAYPPGRAPPTYQIPHNYAYGYQGPGIHGYLGSHGSGPQVQPTAIIAPPPLRPSKPARRTKAHVPSACVNCKKAHLSCDVQRPCGRCVSSGKQDTCKDVQHKKRGRPRLRDDKDFGRTDEERPPPPQLLGALPTSGPERYPQQPEYSSSHRPIDPLRELRRPTLDTGNNSNTHSQSVGQTTGGRPASVGNYSAPVYATGPNLAYQSLPVAFLNLDLVIIKSNQTFQDLVACLGDIRGKSLAEFLEVRQSDVLHRIRNELRDERDEREPTYMAPITPLGQDPVQSVEEKDIDRFSHGYTDKSFLLNFRLPNGQYQSLQTQIRLAKTSLFFVTLVVHTPPRPAGPPLLTQQLAPPTPVRASQSLSAPTTAPPRDFGPYYARPSSSASSAPTSPYFNFTTVRTSLPAIGASTYGSSPSYSYSPTAGPEQGYFPTIQPPSQPSGYPSPYPPLPRSNSIASNPLRTQDSPREQNPPRLEGLQLPPIRTAPVSGPLTSPHGHELSDITRDRIRPHGSPSSAGRPDTPETGKRRRLNIHEVLE
ncbi:hypothetical protein B0J11DRAFT_430600 [Dendryphion nanum]|uniref:Zn(2)-C6 fungal-type domain-containing protein n=1 Tax=Dendryphion nanum TaxID=256645 RepID=A0A9P9E499_9PLEO|nr:hypothetical protein B0J11DRAFT_430600 [Dendryphion nanum]